MLIHCYLNFFVRHRTLTVIVLRLLIFSILLIKIVFLFENNLQLRLLIQNK